MKLRPLFDRVLLKREELKTATGLIIPDAAKERNAPTRGVVVAIGESVTAVKIGDRVLFGVHAGAPLKVDGVETFVVAEEDIIAVVEA